MDSGTEFEGFLSIGEIESRVVACVNRCAAERGVKWEVANFDFAFDGENDDYALLSTKVDNRISMADGIRRMDLIMQNNPHSTRHDIAIDFEMERAVDVEIMTHAGRESEPVFRIVSPVEIKDVIDEAAKWLGDCERKYEPPSRGAESVRESAARIVNRRRT